MVRQQFWHQMNVVGSVVSSTLGRWRGAQALVTWPAQPPLPLTLYDIEGDSACRLLREALTALHLDVEIRPCPKGGRYFRPEALMQSPHADFPVLVDANTRQVIVGAVDAVNYVFTHYSRGTTPSSYVPDEDKMAAGRLAERVRGGRGLLARPSRRPEKPLHLWSFEASPYSRLVRERLCELELPYTLHNMGKERWQDIGPAMLRLRPGPYVPTPGGKRDLHFQRTGHMQVPYLEDPNTGAALLESADIIDYLEQTYALS